MIRIRIPAKYPVLRIRAVAFFILILIAFTIQKSDIRTCPSATGQLHESAHLLPCVENEFRLFSGIDHLYRNRKLAVLKHHCRNRPLLQVLCSQIFRHLLIPANDYRVPGVLPFFSVLHILTDCLLEDLQRRKPLILSVKADRSVHTALPTLQSCSLKIETGRVRAEKAVISDFRVFRKMKGHDIKPVSPCTQIPADIDRVQIMHFVIALCRTVRNKFSVDIELVTAVRCDRDLVPAVCIASVIVIYQHLRKIYETRRSFIIFRPVLCPDPVSMSSFKVRHLLHPLSLWNLSNILSL